MMNTLLKSLILLITYCSALQLEGQSVFETLLHSKALTEDGRSEDAVSLITSVLNIKEDNRLYIERADLYIRLRDYRKAIADYKRANELVANSGDYGLSKAYALSGDKETSIYHLERSMKSPYRKTEKEIMLDPAFSVIENSQEWRLFWKNKWYSDLETGVSELEYYINSDMKEDALLKMAELESQYRDNEKVIYARALMSLYSGKAAEALGSLSDLVTSNPDNEKYLRLMAKTQIVLSNYAGASVTFTRLLDAEIPDASVYISRAECYHKTGEIKRAEADIQKYLAYYPESKKALQLSGKIYTASGNYLKALEYFSENLKYHPGDAECYIDRADIYLLSRSWDWATKDYSMSLDLDPSNSEAWLNKGIALLNMGNTDDACHDFEKSFSLGNKKAINYLSKHCIR